MSLSITSALRPVFEFLLVGWEGKWGKDARLCSEENSACILSLELELQGGSAEGQGNLS